MNWMTYTNRYFTVLDVVLYFAWTVNQMFFEYYRPRKNSTLFQHVIKQLEIVQFIGKYKSKLKSKIILICLYFKIVGIGWLNCNHF